MNLANGGKEMPGILWNSELVEGKTAEQFVNKDKYIIQIWTTGHHELIPEVLEKGYNVIMSNYDAFYFDCGAAWWVGKGPNWCAPYKGWQDAYDNDLYFIAKNLTKTEKHNDQIFGGEATLWTESVGSETVESKVKSIEFCMFSLLILLF